MHPNEQYQACLSHAMQGKHQIKEYQDLKTMMQLLKKIYTTPDTRCVMLNGMIHLMASSDAIEPHKETQVKNFSFEGKEADNTRHFGTR